MIYQGLSLEGKVALVTGSGRGIGETLAIGLAQAGADVVVSDLEERLKDAQLVKERIERLGRRSNRYFLDVQDITSIQDCINEVVKQFGQLDILVNNAGIRRRQPALDVTEEEWEAVINTNLKGTFFCSQAAARHMIPKGFGRIINVSSQLAVVGGVNRAAYCASKGGVASLTQVLALEWIKHGITVNAIGPGPTETPGLLQADNRTDTELAHDLSENMPLGRRMSAEELIGATVYLASPSASATTGHLLVVDGGWTSR